VTVAIDALVNVEFGDRPMPDWMIRVKEDYFKAGDSFLKSPTLDELLEDMDANGVERAILMTTADATDGRAFSFAEARPDRFALGVGGFDLLRPMPALREVQAIVAGAPVAYVAAGPSFWGDGQYPPTDAVYFPLYTKCCELELPLCMNAGIPGPPLPAEAQHPLHYDRVLHRFPELKLCLIHGADPWWDIAIRIVMKYPNARMMTSAWSPRHLPEVLLHFMRTRGKDRVIFASDYPVLSFERTLKEAEALDLPDDVREGWLHGNATEFFFDRLR
jgi:predicted TIM-barrel fold metal-dependent hydrolase